MKTFDIKRYFIRLFFCWLGFVTPTVAQEDLQSEINRIEPLNWWVGMKNPHVQLMVYEKNIGETLPQINDARVELRKVNRVSNPNYLFLDLIIKPNAKAGHFLIQFFKAGKAVFTYNYELKQRKKNAAQRKSFDNSDVIYLITPDRFADGDPANDNSPLTLEKANRADKDGRHGGDIQGVIDHLDYIKDMGFTTIWNMPLTENNQQKFTYHGYAISDFYKIDPRYGTNEQFRELSDKAHQKGLKLIMDVVLNHCGDAHWWMKDLPSQDWINFGGEFSATNHKREIHQDIHASEFDAQHHTDGWFVPSMPDLNQRNEMMANYLIQNTLWWIEYANLDGLRIDTYPYSDKKFLAAWSKSILNEYPNLNMVGEEWSLKPSIVSYWQKNKQNYDGYVSYLPSLMDFPLQNAIVEALNEDDKIYNKGLAKLYQTLAEDFLYAKPDNLVVFLDNHDMSRFNTQINENPALLKMGLAYLLTTRGIPQVYYGTEIGMTNPKSDTHGEIRGDFAGGWSGDTKNVFTETNLTKLEKEYKDFLQKLLQWRKTATAVHSGKLVQFAPDNGIYAYCRYDKKQKFLVLFNKNKTNVDIKLDKYQEVLGQAKALKDVLTNETFQKSLTLPSVGFRIVEVLE